VHIEELGVRQLEDYDALQEAVLSTYHDLDLTLMVSQ